MRKGLSIEIRINIKNSKTKRGAYKNYEYTDTVHNNLDCPSTDSHTEGSDPPREVELYKDSS
jgi:hypothetical protein